MYFCRTIMKIKLYSRLEISAVSGREPLRVGMKRLLQFLACLCKIYNVFTDCFFGSQLMAASLAAIAGH